MRLYLRYMSILLKSQMQYRLSFILLSTGQFFVPLSVFASLYFLFQRFGNIKGWNFYEVALCFAVIHIAFSISECFVRGFDNFSSVISNGEFDRILVRPRNTILQVLGAKFEFSRIGRFLQSIFVLVIALSNLNISWSIAKVITLLFMITGGIFIFSGIFILAATMCFWTIQGIEAASIFTDGGREMSQYPLDIYKKWVTRFFTFVVPFACINYYPLLYILGKVSKSQLYYMLTPLYGVVFIIPCILVWRFGVRHYRSTGS